MNSVFAKHVRSCATYAMPFGLMSFTVVVAYQGWWYFHVNRLLKSLPPGPAPESPIMGLLRYLFPKWFDHGLYSSDLDLFWAEPLHEQYGDTFTLWQPPRKPRVITRNPSAIEEALRQDGKTWHFPADGIDAMKEIYGSSISTLCGQEHATRRSLINEWWIKDKGEGGESSFNQMLLAVHDIMNHGLFKKLKAAAQGAGSLPLSNTMKTFALEGMLAVVFGAQVTKDLSDGHASDELSQAHITLNWRIFGRLLGRTYTCWPKPISLMLERLDDILGGWNTKVRRAWQVFVPFLDSLDVPQDGGLASWMQSHMLTNPGQRMYWRGQAWDFIDGGVDTVMAYLQQSLLLIYSPRLKTTLIDVRNEISGCQCVCADGYHRLKPTAHNLSEDRLPLLESVLKECMRLFPPILTQLPRVNVKAGSTRLCELLGMAPQAQTKVVLILNIFGLHRHPVHWERPHEFLPERWNVIKTGISSYRPFGGGIHGCLSFKYLPFQLRMVVGDIINNFDLELDENSANFIPDSFDSRSESSRQAVADVESLLLYDQGMAFERQPLTIRIRLRQHPKTHTDTC